jgi:hypothetical protein
MRTITTHVANPINDKLIIEVGDSPGDFVGPRMPLDIPLSLIISQEDRKAAWIGRKVTSQFHSETEEAWRVREQERRDLIAAEIKAKNARGLERMKEKHAGQKYDRKTKTWIKVEEPMEA